jgi:hypothetical protein
MAGKRWRCAQPGGWWEYVPCRKALSLFWIVLGDKVKGRMQIAELVCVDRGGTPDRVQRWQPPPEKAICW